MLPAAALTSPINVTSETVEIQDLKNTILMVFLENAYINGDSFNLHGNKIEILVENNSLAAKNTSTLNSIKEIHATDNASFSQKLNNGKADKISIYPDKKLLILEGNAEISDIENGTIYGERLTLDNKNMSIKTDGLGARRSTVSINDNSKFIGTNLPIKKTTTYGTSNQE